jgi:hypothetical protein
VKKKRKKSPIFIPDKSRNHGHSGGKGTADQGNWTGG